MASKSKKHGHASSKLLVVLDDASAELSAVTEAETPVDDEIVELATDEMKGHDVIDPAAELEAETPRIEVDFQLPTEGTPEEGTSPVTPVIVAAPVTKEPRPETGVGRASGFPQRSCRRGSR